MSFYTAIIPPLTIPRFSSLADAIWDANTNAWQRVQLDIIIKDGRAPISLASPSPKDVTFIPVEIEYIALPDLAVPLVRLQQISTDTGIQQANRVLFQKNVDTTI